MFGFSLISTEELQNLRLIASKWYKAEAHAWWPHQDFVSRLLRRVISGEHDMWRIRKEFNDSLDAYVQKMLVEKLQGDKDTKSAEK